MTLFPLPYSREGGPSTFIRKGIDPFRPDCVDRARMNHGSRASVVDPFGNVTTNGEIRAGEMGQDQG
jgi:hypothetical protein